MKMLPDITHLQFLVLETIQARERSGRFIREKLEEFGQRKSLPAFYQMMARLEEAQLVKGRYQVIEVEGQQLKERLYKITNAGLRELDVTSSFYDRREVTFSTGVRHG